MNSECLGVQERLPLYEEGALEAGQASEVREHLSRCASCRAEAALSEASWKIFRQAHAPVPAPKLPEMGPFPAGPRPVRYSPGWALGLAAAAFLLGLAVGRRTPESRRSRPTAAVLPSTPAAGRDAGTPETGAPDLPLVLGDSSLSGRPGLAAPPVWAEAETALTAKPVARPGPSGLSSAPRLGAGGSGLSASPHAADEPSGLLVTPPVGARRPGGAQGVTFWKEGLWEKSGC